MWSADGYFIKILLGLWVCILSRTFLILLVFAISAFPQTDDTAIQTAINEGAKWKIKALWKSIEKHKSVSMMVRGRAKMNTDTVAKWAIFLSDEDLIMMASSDASRRHQKLTMAEVKSWPGLGTTHVLLKAMSGGLFAANLSKWQAPAVHMILTADGVEIQPLSEGRTETSRLTILPTEHGIATSNHGITSYTPLYETAIYDMTTSRTWFAFDVPPHPSFLSVTVISSDGHEKNKEVPLAVLALPAKPKDNSRNRQVQR